jgi:hypothetical protein
MAGKLSGIFMKKRFDGSALSYLSIYMTDFDEKMNLNIFADFSALIMVSSKRHRPIGGRRAGHDRRLHLMGETMPKAEQHKKREQGNAPFPLVHAGG